MSRAALLSQIRRFAELRNWERFHTPKNLAMALHVEAAELAEIFQWLTPEQSRRLTPKQLAALKDELADVYVYLLKLSSAFQVDLDAAARAKMRKNARKYPVQKARDSAAKYTELRPPVQRPRRA